MKSPKSLAAGIAPFFLLPLTAHSAVLTYSGGFEVEATAPIRSASFESPSPYTGTPATTGALTASSVLGTALSPQPVSPTATTYPSDGDLHDPQPAPFFPGGGLGTTATPVYNVRSDYDYQSLVCLNTPKPPSRVLLYEECFFR